MKKAMVVLMLALAIIGLAACAPKETYEEYRVRIKQEFIEESPKEAKGGIVFLGDSITDGYETKKFSKEYEVINRGITGDTTADVLDRLQSTCLIMQPKLIVLLIGVNNLSADGNSAFDGTKKILQEIFAANKDTKVIIQSLYPLNKTDGYYTGTICNDDVLNYNKRLQPLAAEFGCVYVNMHAELIDKDGNFSAQYTGDGLHPNKEGYAVITAKLKPIVDSAARECGII